MSPQTTALNNRLIGEFFTSGKKAVGSGRYTAILGKSKSGPCEQCRKMAGNHNIGSMTPQPPHHPNCKCQIK